MKLKIKLIRHNLCFSFFNSLGYQICLPVRRMFNAVLYTPLSGAVSFLSVIIDAHRQLYSSQDYK